MSSASVDQTDQAKTSSLVTYQSDIQAVMQSDLAKHGSKHLRPSGQSSCLLLCHE